LEGLEHLVDRAGAVVLKHGSDTNPSRGKLVSMIVSSIPVRKPERIAKAPTARVLNAMLSFRNAETELRESMSNFDQLPGSKDFDPTDTRKRFSRVRKLMNRSSVGDIIRARRRGWRSCLSKCVDLVWKMICVLGADLAIKVLLILCALAWWNFPGAPTASTVGQAIGTNIINGIGAGMSSLFGVATGAGAAIGDGLIQTVEVAHNIPATSVTDATGSETLGYLAGTSVQLAGVYALACWAFAL
jgi:hypothetical protein